MCRSDLSPEPGYTFGVESDRHGIWYVTCRVTATGQVIRCGGYYLRPADEQLPKIAGRLFKLRRSEVYVHENASLASVTAPVSVQTPISDQTLDYGVSDAVAADFGGAM